VPARHCSNLWTISGLRHEYKPWSTSLSDMTDIYEEGVAVAVCDAVDSVTLWGVACAKYLCYRCCSCCASFSIGSAGDLEVSVCKQLSINVESPVGKKLGHDTAHYCQCLPACRRDNNSRPFLLSSLVVTSSSNTRSSTSCNPK
jgi:hypothetical protein